MQAALDRALNSQPASPEAYKDRQQPDARIKELEEKIQQLQALLAQRENMLKHLQQQSANHLDNENMARIAEQATQWERDNVRLNRMLAQAKHAFTKVEGRANALEEAMIAQKAQTSKYQKEARRLANELRNLSEAMRLMSQDMEHQMSRLPVRPREGVTTD
jgi:archaellum component FlaC